MLIKVLCSLLLFHAADGFVETAPVTTVMKCSSAIGPECCPAACTERRLTSVAAARECSDATPSKCVMSMTASADFFQTPCMVPIPSTLSSGGKILPNSYSTWIKFPDGIFNTLLPWTTGRIEGKSTLATRSHGCRVALAGLGIYPQDNSCAPLPEEKLYPMPMLNHTFGSFDGLLAMGGASDGINIIFEVWTVGKTNNLKYIEAWNARMTEKHKKYGHIEWDPRCDDLGSLNLNIRVTGSATGRSDVRKSSYPATPFNFTLPHP